MPTATLKDGRNIEFLPDMIGDGAMKEVYFTKDKSEVVCFYKDYKAGADPVRLRRLEKILGSSNPTVPRDPSDPKKGGSAKNAADAAYFKDLFCWPTAIITKPRFGIVCPTYPGDFFFSSGPDFIKGKEKNGMRFFGMKNRKLLEKFAPTELGNFCNYLSLCIKTARAVARLHNAGLAHSDLSPNNVLVAPTLGKSIIIDVDSLVVEGMFPPDVAGTKGYIAPEVISTFHLPMNDPNRKFPNARTDLHALATLTYQYLLLRHPLDGKRIPNANDPDVQEALAYGKEALFCEHPTDTKNRPELNPYIPYTALGPPLTDLFQRAFVKGLHAPNDRPSAMEWLRGLNKTWDLLQKCGNAACSQKWFVLADFKSVKCPFCNTRPKGAIPLLRLKRDRGKDTWMADGEVAVYQDMCLFKWHVFTDVYPGPEADKTPQAYCAFHQGQWILVNQHLDSMTSAAGNPVPKGQAVVLNQGKSFRLAAGPNGRCVDVEIVGN